MDGQVGQLVTSRAGRDAGQQFLVIGYMGRRVLVADGRARSVQRPKQKNLRHVSLHEVWAKDVRVKLLANVSVSNADIRDALEELQDGVREVDRQCRDKT